MAIHPSAIIDKEVELEKDVEVGPYSIIRGRVRIGKGTKIDSHVSIGHPTGVVHIGANNHVWTGAFVGGPPQDLSYKGEATKLEIGDNNIIREFVTMNCGTTKGGGVTRVKNNCLLMAYTHIAHDCMLGNNVVVANTCQFAGHVEVDDFARIGGMCGIAQFVRIGKYAYIGGSSSMNKDILPFSIAEGTWAKVRATNKVGLERAGFSPDEVSNIYRAIKAMIVGGNTVEEALKKISETCEPSENIKHLVKFIETSKIGIAR